MIIAIIILISLVFFLSVWIMALLHKVTSLDGTIEDMMNNVNAAAKDLYTKAPDDLIKKLEKESNEEADFRIAFSRLEICIYRNNIEDNEYKQYLFKHIEEMIDSLIKKGYI